MTTKDMATRTGGAIDFTMMYVTHDAFRRDLGRFTAASAAGTAHSPGVRAGWENFKAQLLLHHSVEDTHLWPRVRRVAAGLPSGLALLDGMEAEHAQIDPLLTAVDDALTGSGGNLAPDVRVVHAADADPGGAAAADRVRQADPARGRGHRPIDEACAVPAGDPARRRADATSSSGRH